MNATNRAEKLAAIRDALALKPDGILEMLAQEHGVTLAEVMECLPPEAAYRVDGAHYVEVLGDVAEWGDITFICHSKDAIVEFSGPLPKGRIGHGMYNLQGSGNGISGHLRPERCAAIYFVRRPFMGMETVSVQFFNPEGEASFKIYIGRDEERRLRTDQIERFTALKDRLAPLGAAA